MATIAYKNASGSVIVSKSVHTPDYNDAKYIINPKIPDCPTKYMDIKDGKLVKITKTQITAIDKAVSDGVVARDKTLADLKVKLKSSYTDDEINLIIGS